MSSAPIPKKPASSKSRAVWILILLALVAVLAYRVLRPRASTEITFADYGNDYSSKPDFADVEHRFPLSPAQLMTLTPQSVLALDQEKIDQIYARLTAGPIPDGAYDGDLSFPKGISGSKRLGEVVGGAKRWAADLELNKLTLLGRQLWKGKVFYRDQRVLRNRIDDLGLFADFFPDQADADEVKRLAAAHPTSEEQYFPAKLYCGQSLLDSRRESVIIDYAFTDELPGYRRIPDKLAGREFLLVRDEIRMVRPGFYLGRAYMAGAFILNFTLYNKAVADAGSSAFLNNQSGPEDCWIGLQRLTAAAHSHAMQ
jgi:hypothetical protein